jgi:acetylornithine deacetylase/succinyl-diaminopimelate desuccinylase-like protein
LHVYVSDPPTVLDETLPIVAALRAAQTEVTGESPASIIRRPGADSVHLTAYGVPCVAFGPGGRMHPDARNVSMHAFGEHVLIDDCVAAAKVYLATALDVCSRKAP